MAASRAVTGSGRRRVTRSTAPGKIGGHVPPGMPGADRLRARMAEAAFTLHRLVAEPAGLGPKADRRKMWAFAHARGQSLNEAALASPAGQAVSPADQMPDSSSATVATVANSLRNVAR